MLVNADRINLSGSFSDNELSPECLDGAMRLMKDDGHSVPCEYTSYLAPLSSRKLFNAVDNQPDNKREDKFHQGYVVRLLNCYVFDKSKKCFVFQHSNSDKSEVNMVSNPSLLIYVLLLPHEFNTLL